MAKKTVPAKKASKKSKPKKRAPSPTQKAKSPLPSGLAAKMAKSLSSSITPVETIDRTTKKVEAYWHAIWRFKFKGRLKVSWNDAAEGLKQLKKDVKELSRRGLMVIAYYHPDPESTRQRDKTEVWSVSLSAAERGSTSLGQAASECEMYDGSYPNARVLDLWFYIR